MIGLGIIGFGVQGQRMVARLAEHESVRAVAVWDPDPGRVRSVGSGIRLARAADEIFVAPDVHCVYIASPPASHLEHAQRAFDAELPVFCEKPLAVDFGEARLALSRIEREKLRAAVNFSLASSPGLAAVQAELAGGGIGTLEKVEIEVAFREWPRPWQSEAGRWLAERDEGGFTREVLSHFIFVLQRALGPARVLERVVAYPRDGHGAETAISARLRAGDVPVSVEGHVGGDVPPDVNRLALIGDLGTVEFGEWLSTRRRPGSKAPEKLAPGRAPYLRQLDELAAFIEGKPHKLPDFAEALAVQETIEAMLGRA